MIDLTYGGKTARQVAALITTPAAPITVRCVREARRGRPAAIARFRAAFAGLDPARRGRVASDPRWPDPVRPSECDGKRSPRQAPRKGGPT